MEHTTVRVGENKIFIDKDKPFYKGNLHTHSTNTDGKMTFEQLIDLYASHGYDFLGLTDHDRYADDAPTTDKIVLIPGIEVSFYYRGEYTKEIGEYVHLCCFGRRPGEKDETYDYTNGDDLQLGINEVLKKYELVQLNHPNYVKLFDSEWVKTSGFHMMEIYNHKDYREEGGLYSSDHIARMMFTFHRRFAVTAGDDFHGPYLKTVADNCFGGYNMVQSDGKDRDSIVKALREGKFYATNGPKILDYRFEGDTLKIKTSEVQRIIFGTNFRHAKHVLDPNCNDITEAEYKLTGKEYYVFVRAVDKYGNTAWAQPVFIER